MPSPPKMEVAHSHDLWEAGSKPTIHEDLKRVLLIVNPNSGKRKGIKIMDKVKPLLEAGGCTGALRTQTGSECYATKPD